MADGTLIFDTKIDRKGVEEGCKKIGDGFKSTGGKMQSMGLKMTAAGGGLVMVGKKLLEATQVQQDAENKLTEIYKTRMGVDDKAAQSTMNLASKLQKVGVVGDEVTLSGAQQLATYAKYPGTVDKLLPAMDNLLVQQKGLNGTSEDATGIANLMGKAMMGQTGALKRCGISFDEAQEKVLKYGTEEEKAAMLAEVVNQNVGNMNEKFAQTDAGKIQQAKNAIGDCQEELGAMLLPALGKIAGFMSEKIIPAIQSFIGWMGKHPMIANFAVALTGILLVGGPIVMILGTMMSAIGTLITVFGTLKNAVLVVRGVFTMLNLVMSVNPIFLIIAAIVALIAIFVILYNKCEGFRNIVNKVVAFIMPAIQLLVSFWKARFEMIKAAITLLISAIVAMVGKIKAAFNAVKSFASAFGAKLKSIFNSIKSAVAAMASAVVARAMAIVAGFQAMYARVRAVISKVISLAKSLPGKIKSGLGSLVSVGRDFIAGLWNGIKSKWDGMVGRLKSLASGLPAAVKKVLDIGSPSKVMADLGQWIPAGLAVGIEDNFGVVDKAMTALGNATIGGFDVPRFTAGRSAMIAARAGSAAQTAAAGERVVNQTVNFNQPVNSPSETARALRNEARFGLLGGSL